MLPYVYLGMNSKKRFQIMSSAIAVVLAVAAKLSLTRSELLPGLDGAYYWVQVRSIIENQSLAFPDLPLVFWLQAIFAKIVGSVPLGVRMSDAVLPALSAIPIYFITRNHGSKLLPAIATLVILLHPVQLYFFTGDFIKNEVAIPIVFFIVLVLTRWEVTSRKLSIISLTLLLSLVTLTHFGTALLAFMLVGIWAILELCKNGRKSWIKTSTQYFIVLTGFLALIALVIPDRYQRLLDFVTTPSTIFQRPILDGIIQGYANPIIAFTIIISQIFTIILGSFFWRCRNKIPSSQKSLIISSLITALILSSPLISIEWANRLTALSFVPLTTAAILIFCYVEGIGGKSATTTFATVILVAALLFSSFPMKRVFTGEKYVEFRKLAEQVNIPKNSVIIARHGVQYLSAWHFKSDVVLDSYFESANLASYTSVFLLVENSSSDKKEVEVKPAAKTKLDKPKTPASKGSKPTTSAGKETVPSQSSGQKVFSNGLFTLVKIR